MTYSKFKELLECARKCGIKTAGELVAFKAAIGIKTNDELLYSLNRAAKAR